MNKRDPLRYVRFGAELNAHYLPTAAELFVRPFDHALFASAFVSEPFGVHQNMGMTYTPFEKEKTYKSLAFAHFVSPIRLTNNFSIGELDDLCKLFRVSPELCEFQ